MIFLKQLLLIAPGTSQLYKQAYFKANHMKLLAQNHLLVLFFSAIVFVFHTLSMISCLLNMKEVKIF